MAHPIEDRRKTLSKYGRITCRCEACMKQWPVYSELMGREIEFIAELVFSVLILYM